MNEMTTLATIEYRITYHLQGAYANILEVGRALCEAKDANLVPHGEWEEWLRRTAGMSERSAQRLMQAAREVNPESAMAKLPISKIQAILALPEPEREAVAEKAVAENMSLRKLQNEVEGLRKVKRAAEAEAVQANRRAENARLDANQAKETMQRYKRDLDIMDAERKVLREQLREAKAAPATGISDEAQAEIDRLSAQLSDAEQMAEYQANARQQAQRELQELKSRAARGDAAPVEDLTADSVGQAVRTFICAVGYLPHSDRLTGMRYQDRQQVQAFARMVAKWAADVQHALDNMNEAIVIQEARHE